MNAENALDAAFELLGDQHPIQPGAGNRGAALHQGGEAGAHSVRIRDIEQHAADFGFMDDVRRQDFQHHGEADFLGGGHGMFHRGTGTLGGCGNAGGGEQGFGVRLARGGGR